MSTSVAGSFEGHFVLEPVWNDPILGRSGPYDPGDYEMRIVHDFSYVDRALQRHTVKAGTVVNGASIPRAAWTVLGYTPWAGPVQKPSVIHDDMCQRLLLTSDRAHRIFHEGLLVEKVTAVYASIMYAAVSNFGPQWSVPGGEVTRPTFSEGFMRLIMRLLGWGQSVEMVVKPELFGAETKMVRKLQLGDGHFVLKGTGEDADVVDRLSRQIKALPKVDLEGLAVRGEVRLE